MAANKRHSLHSHQACDNDENINECMDHFPFILATPQKMSSSKQFSLLMRHSSSASLLPSYNSSTPSRMIMRTPKISNNNYKPKTLSILGKSLELISLERNEIPMILNHQQEMPPIRSRLKNEKGFSIRKRSNLRKSKPFLKMRKDFHPEKIPSHLFIPSL